MAKRFVVSAQLKAEDRASGTINKVEGSASRLASTLRRGLVVAAGAATAALAGLTAAIVKGVGAAQVQEEAVKKLETALARYGPAGKDAAKGAQEFAAALQKQSTFGDEALIQTQALLVEMGVAPDILNKATQASADLASAFGISLESAARNIGKTMGGFAGELGELIPELKGLSAEALKSGEGIELLAEKFEGRAVAAAGTFSGQIAQVKNAFGDLLEVVGEAITKNPVLQRQLSALSKTLSSKKLQDGAKGFADQLATIAKNATDAAANLGRVAVAVGNAALGLKALEKGDLGQALRDQAEAQEELATQTAFVSRELDQEAEATEQVTRRWGKLIQIFQQALQHNPASVFRNQKLAAKELAEQLAFVVRETKKNNAADLESIELKKRLAALNKRTARLNDEAATRLQSFTEGLQAFGFSLESEVNSQVEKNNKLIEQARILYDQRIEQDGKRLVTLGDLTRLEADVAAENARLASTLVDQNVALADNAQATGEAAKGLKSVGDGARGAGEDLRKLQEELRRTAEEARRTAGTLGSENFGGTQSGGSKLFPDSAIANTARRGGRNIRVLPNGTRVVA